MKKILSVVVVFVLLVAMSVSAFAAAPTTTKNDDGSWTTAGSDAAYANSMMTILAYTEGQAISVDSIQYIDQTTADSTGAYSFANYLPKVDPTTAKYVVKVGGQNISTPLDAGYIEAAAQKVTVKGKVSYIGTKTAATINLIDANGVDVLAAEGAVYTIDPATGNFEFTVDKGVYTLKISKLGHTLYHVDNLELSESVENAAYAIYAGELTNDGEVATPDLLLVIDNLLAPITDDNKACDLTEDDEIATPDLLVVIDNLLKKDVKPAETPAE